MAEIKISELSIGDWVRYEFPEIGKKSIQVNSIDEEDNHIGAGGVGAYAWSDVSNFEPIPLTPEILEKNGFERGKYDEIRVYNEWEIGEWDNPPYVSVRLDIDRQVIRVSNTGRSMWIEDKEVYVHQLQHALRLAGVGKEIEL